MHGPRTACPRSLRIAAPALAAACALACGPGEPEPVPAGALAFAVFGDGPYRSWENGRYRGVLRDVVASDATWLLHVGDILWYPCSDEEYAKRRDALNALPVPVVYTPGDNEWADCHDRIAGGYAPLDRLASLRATFFADPGHSLGGRPMPVRSQGLDPAYSEFVENARWRRGGFLFATFHMVGGANASMPFDGRTAADDLEVQRRERAAVAWLDDAFRIARTDSMHGVVLAMHANPFDEEGYDIERGFETFFDRLARLAADFPGMVLLIHGDSHTQRSDQPLADPRTGERLDNFTRLETFGSPDIGWVRVVLDTVAGTLVRTEPRLQPRWRLW